MTLILIYFMRFGQSFTDLLAAVAPSFLIDLYTLQPLHRHALSFLLCITGVTVFNVLFAVSNLTLISALGVILIDLNLYATLEKHSKESWVIRETTEKSFKTFLNMVDENPKEVFIIDKSGALQFINKRAQDLLLKSTKNITSFFDIVHKRNQEKFILQVHNVIKTSHP